jgi:hypothetical protein
LSVSVSVRCPKLNQNEKKTLGARTIQQINNHKQREYPAHIQRLLPAPSPAKHNRIHSKGDEERRAAANVQEHDCQGEEIQEASQGTRLERAEGVDLG